jgi:hypothetical protein
MNLKEGDQVFAIIKATEVSVEKGISLHTSTKSARAKTDAASI